MASHRNAMMFLGLPKTVLTVLGMWTIPHRDRLYKNYTIVTTILMLTFMAFNIVYMTEVWGDLHKMMEGSYFLFTHLSTCFKTLNFVIRKNAFQKLLEAMDSGIFSSPCQKHEDILLLHSSRAKKIYTVIAVVTFLICLQWSVIPLMDTSHRFLPYDIWMPGDEQVSPNYELGYIYQVVVLGGSAQVFVAIDHVFIIVIMFCCAQIQIILADIEKISNVPTYGLSPNDKKELNIRNNQLLAECIRHHQAVIRFLGLVKNMFHIPIFLQLSGTIFIICVLGFQMTVETPDSVHFYSTLNYFLAMLSQLYIYCWCGNELTIRCEKLRDCFYFCPWYGHDKKFGQNLCFVMEYLRRPLVFKAGHYIALSRPTFVAILRCSYSYFAVLNQAQKELE